MRNRPLFALGMCAAALLGRVSLTRADQGQSPKAQNSGQQSASQQSPQTAKPASSPKTQSAPPSQQTDRPPFARNAQSATLSPQAGKQTSAQKPQATTPSPQTAKQASGTKGQAARPLAIPPGYRLLSLKEGRTIVQEMSWADDEEGLSPDCSHLVHKLYEQAGHPYPYASSFDLYRGAAPFLRVRYAHPGDLVVWRGHVGIVMNPREHSFFSTTSSGARTENYRSPYWRARGYPHFFRYLTKSPLKGGTTSEASNRPPALQPSASRSSAPSPKDPPQD
ncbi:MAG TPA: NlpC/P60 family protein [Candidatus Acidoferrum sp.]|nr:NlpC/P60 family protein [Candidatus Acidoferrum sp.]